MNTNNALSNRAGRLTTACASGLLPLLLLLALPAVVEAQFNYTNNYGIWTCTTNNGGITIMGYTGPGGAVAIPDRIPDTANGLPVTGLGGWAFWNCTSLTSAAIPDSATSIGDSAFNGCTRLTSVTIGNGVTCIGDYAFDCCSSLASVTIPNGVTSIGYSAFEGCTRLAAITVNPGNPVYSSVAGVLFNGNQTTLIQYPPGNPGSYTIPNPVTRIGDSAFSGCSGLSNVTIGNRVTRIGNYAFCWCSSLTSVVIPSSVNHIGDSAFYGCTSLAGLYFEGNAPSLGSNVFDGDNNATVGYVCGTTGWGTTFGGRPVIALAPSILTPPATQTAEIGSLAFFWVQVTNTLPGGTCYQWFFSGTNALGGATNAYLDITGVQPAQAGAYTVVVTNLGGAITSTPALLSVIPPVERRVVPALHLTGDVGSFLHLDCANAFAPGASWLPLTNFTLLSTPQLYVDVSAPLPAQRFYRAWQTNVPSARPALDMSLVTRIPLTGAIASSVRIDYINAIGPTNAWVTLNTVVLTNTPQLYLDLTAFGQAPRLYRLIASP